MHVVGSEGFPQDEQRIVVLLFPLRHDELFRLSWRGGIAAGRVLRLWRLCNLIHFLVFVVRIGNVQQELLFSYHDYGLFGDLEVNRAYGLRDILEEHLVHLQGMREIDSHFLHFLRVLHEHLLRGD